MNYQQCLLKKDTLFQRSFIPSQFAKLGSILIIQNELGEWENGWNVDEVSSIVVDEAHLPDSHKEIKAHRKKTGDAESKDKEKRMKS